jgi:hypothetical protein
MVSSAFLGESIYILLPSIVQIKAIAKICWFTLAPGRAKALQYNPFRDLPLAAIFARIVHRYYLKSED